MFATAILGFSMCMFGTVGALMCAEAGSRFGLSPEGWVSWAGNHKYFENRAQYDPGQDRELLARAVQLNPRAASAWIALGLAAERAARFSEAQYDFAQAERWDHQYLPAWSRANYSFRTENHAQFWMSARHAAGLVYDDPIPLVELADRGSPDALTALRELGGRRAIARGYLDYLIGRNRWSDARDIALELEHTSGRNETPAAYDIPRYLDLVDRLIEAGQWTEAQEVWNGAGQWQAISSRRGALINGGFRTKPGGHGFDWRLTGYENVDWKWGLGEIELRLNGNQDVRVLLEQALAFSSAGCLRFESETNVHGLRWQLMASKDSSQAIAAQLIEESSPLAPADSWQGIRVCFRKPRAANAKLRLVYRRELGIKAAGGEIRLRNLYWEET